MIYGYDAIGSFEPKTYVAQGSGQSMVAGLLDAHIQGFKIITNCQYFVLQGTIK